MTLNCLACVKAMTDAAEGALGPIDRIGHRLHLLICPHCRRYRSQLQQTVEALGDLSRSSGAEPPVSEDLLARVRARRKPD